jgi:hypothetical protein
LLEILSSIGKQKFQKFLITRRKLFLCALRGNFFLAVVSLKVELFGREDSKYREKKKKDLRLPGLALNCQCSCA